MQFYFIEKKTKILLWDWYGKVFKNLLYTDRWLMTTWNNRHLQFWHRNPSQWNHPRNDKLPTGLYLNCYNFFYLEDFGGGIGVMLLKFRLLRSPDIFWNHVSWSQKEEISRSTSSTSTSALDSLIAEVSELHPFSSNFVQLALVVVWSSASLAGLVSTTSLNYCSWLQCNPWSLNSVPKILFNAEPVGFLAFSSWHKENLTRTEANLQWNNQIENSLRAQMKYHTAICITHDNWQWILIRCRRAIRS